MKNNSKSTVCPIAKTTFPASKFPADPSFAGGAYVAGFAMYAMPDGGGELCGSNPWDGRAADLGTGRTLVVFH